MPDQLLNQTSEIPRFGARKTAEKLALEVKELRSELESSGALSAMELEKRKSDLEQAIADDTARLERQRAEYADEMERYRHKQLSNVQQQMASITAQLQEAQARLDAGRNEVVHTEETVLLQEVGVYEYHHPLSDAVAYQVALAALKDEIKAMNKAGCEAIESATDWTVNGSSAQGRKMLNELSKLMLRAFNAEADNLVRNLKPYKVEQSVDRLIKVASTIERLGKTMQIRVSNSYFQLRAQELRLTADFLQKKAVEKELEREERERLREERKVQQELDRELQRLEKERLHYENALSALREQGDDQGAARIQEKLNEIERAKEDVDYRAANIRAGYVYVISNIGSLGPETVKVGLTRRLDPKDRIRELSDASVPFNFDVHALFFSDDAVGIESELHKRLAGHRVNRVNKRREFFHVTPIEVKEILAELAGELLEFEENPEAFEYRQSIADMAVEGIPASGASASTD